MDLCRMSAIFIAISLTALVNANVTNAPGGGGSASIPGGTDFGTDFSSDGGADFGTDFGTGDLKCAPDTCQPPAVCNDTYGYISCQCPHGKAGTNCDMVDPCLQNTTNCPVGKKCFGDCPPNMACEGAQGIPHCRGCVPGWTGALCEQDVDECTYESCANDGVCSNTIGSYLCTCKSGWTGQDCRCKQGSTCDKPEETKGPTGGAVQLSSTAVHCLVIVFLTSVLSL